MLKKLSHQQTWFIILTKKHKKTVTTLNLISMKKIFTFLLYLIILNTSSAQIDENLIAFYPFAGNSQDESGNGHHGEVMGATLVEDRFGNAESAYSFDGNDDFIQVPDHPTLRFSSSYSVSLWFKINDFSNVNAFAFLSKRSGCNASGYLKTIIGTDHIQGHEQGALLAINSGCDDPISKSNQKITDFEWHHLVYVFDGNTNLMQTYIDGNLDQTEVMNTPVDDTTADLFIGKDPLSSFNNMLMDGVLDDIRTYDKKLTEEDVTTLFEIAPNAIAGAVQPEKLVLYPNPTSGEVKILDEANQVSFIKIIDAKGVIVTKKSNVKTIDLTGFSSGIYYVFLFDKNGELIRKELIVKAKPVT